MALASPNGYDLASRGAAITAFGAGGDKLLVADDFHDVDGGGGPATADLDLVDLSQGDAGAGAPVVSGLPIFFDTGTGVRNVAVTSDHTAVVYATRGGSAPGIYVTRLP
jgi:hypothetical protein